MAEKKQESTKATDATEDKKAVVEEQKTEETAAPVLAKETEETVKKTAGKKKKTIRQIAHGRAYVQATYNNTIITLTDLNGNVLAWSSAGQNNFKGPKKATPYAASIIVKTAVEKANPYGLKNVNVFVKGVGSGREAAIRALNTYGLNIVSVKDITPIPHNGCRRKRPRRV